QVNVAHEAGKAGVAPGDLAALLDGFVGLDHVRCRGLMLIPPAGSPEQTRPHFAALGALARHHGDAKRPGVELTELSMGMSADFGVAIEEGATMVRVGTAIFGPRPSPSLA
nr:alanine racemase [Deltaproteobacteria bacterium]